MQWAGRSGMVLMAEEIGQHILPAPAGKAPLTPAIIIRRLAAHVDHRIDSGGAADDAPARIAEHAPVQPGLRLCLEQPVGTRIADGIKIPHRDVEPDPVILAPASISSTLRAGSAESRFASTQPAEPAPMIMTSASPLPP